MRLFRQSQGKSPKEKSTKDKSSNSLLDALDIDPALILKRCHVTLGKEIGSGAFGAVYLCEVQNWNVKVVAKKVMTNKVKPADASLLRNEVTFWAQLDHPNVIKARCCPPPTACLHPSDVTLCCGCSSLDSRPSHASATCCPSDATGALSTMSARRPTNAHGPCRCRRCLNGCVRWPARWLMFIRWVSCIVTSSPQTSSSIAACSRSPILVSRAKRLRERCAQPIQPHITPSTEAPTVGVLAWQACLTAETGSYRWMAPEVMRHEPYGASCDV
jgi:hypothetical protein